MSGEAGAMAGQGAPVTVDSIVSDLRALGVEPGITLVVHSSLSSLGWVSGGAQAVVLALQEAVGDSGTLAMPAHSGHLSDPAQWRNPPLPDESWLPAVYDTMPAFDVHLTLPRQMGAIVESFRSQPDVLRSDHPHMSFVARGPNALQVTQCHLLESGLGEHSPLARLYDLDARVLLLGVPHSNNTSLHLAEYRVPPEQQTPLRQGAPVVRDGRRAWVWFEDIDLDAGVFDELGADFASDTGLETVGKVGGATARFMPQRALVDYAVQWLERRKR